MNQRTSLLEVGYLTHNCILLCGWVLYSPSHTKHFLKSALCLNFCLLQGSEHPSHSQVDWKAEVVTASRWYQGREEELVRTARLWFVVSHTSHGQNAFLTNRILAISGTNCRTRRQWSTLDREHVLAIVCSCSDLPIGVYSMTLSQLENVLMPPTWPSFKAAWGCLSA
jgi:hypothetical protein